MDKPNERKGLVEERFAAVRHSEGKEFFDTNFAYTEEDMRFLAEAYDRNLPGAARKNPIRRIVRVRIEEVVE